MKIVIIGDGKVGYKLAKQLSSEKYDIILIDNNERKTAKNPLKEWMFFVLREKAAVWRFSRGRMYRMRIW